MKGMPGLGAIAGVDMGATGAEIRSQVSPGGTQAASMTARCASPAGVQRPSAHGSWHFMVWPSTSVPQAQPSPRVTWPILPGMRFHMSLPSTLALNMWLFALVPHTSVRPAVMCTRIPFTDCQSPSSHGSEQMLVFPDSRSRPHTVPIPTEIRAILPGTCLQAVPPQSFCLQTLPNLSRAKTKSMPASMCLKSPTTNCQFPVHGRTHFQVSPPSLKAHTQPFPGLTFLMLPPALTTWNRAEPSIGALKTVVVITP